MVGAGTVVIDDPLLTDRSGKPRRQPLARIILDARLQTPASSQLARTAHDSPVLLFSKANKSDDAVAALEDHGVEVVHGDGRDVLKVLEELGRRSIQSVLIEGGSGVAGAFIDAGLVSKVTFFVAPVIIGGRDAPTAGGGLGAERMAQALRLEEVEITQRGSDVEITGYPQKRMKDEG
jgi:diaminohydroxyphosphoribosylaminopyrimidine deaminase/5-amino-6-(5-phosphoribosylamino)uracil reductase